MTRGTVLRTPDWADLLARLDAVCVQRGLLTTRTRRPDYAQLAVACGLSRMSLYAWRRHESRPSRATLEKLAQYAGQPIEPWLTAAGLSVAEECAS